MVNDNRLSESTSPYLLQHKDNPVDWRPWGPEALAEAKASDKPILLSVGYAACHWCHVMAHESFEDEDVAGVMNRLFVNIKVDREERPDIDQIYMTALHALGEQGGWPLTMFLTPDGEPFWGGTYFPKQARWGRPSFIDVMEAVSKAYRSDRDRIDVNRTSLMAALRQPQARAGEANADLVRLAGEKLLSLTDPVNGGMRGAPKFPQASVMELIWRTGLRTGSDSFADAALKALTGMSLGGIYDHIGGGLCRYSVDDRWLVPHFEKMLYDNAQYLSQLTLAYGKTKNPLFLIRIEETADWLLREMRAEGSAFTSSFDADSEGEEGLFYIWTPQQIVAVLGEDAGNRFNQLYDITPAGNFEGRNIPNLLQRQDAAVSIIDETKQARAALYDARSARVPPQRDDKVLADWNGLAIAALASAAEAVSRESWRRAALEAYRFIMTTMADERGRLAHSCRDGRYVRPGFASDYACMMHAAAALAETSRDDEQREGFLKDAARLLSVLEADYANPAGGYFLTSEEAEDVIVRLCSAADESVPNYHGVLVGALSKLWHMTGNDSYRQKADDVLNAFAETIPQNIFATASLLGAFDTRLSGQLAVVIAPGGTDPSPLLQALAQLADPAIVRYVTQTNNALPASHPAHGKTAIDGRPTLYLCREGACSLPITDPSAIGES
ncbi:thioredoxin domain-containing protein [Stappia sp. F7233]|uniref:Thioredoxin domain-containing protein n=1 Tax=Stappia albiluteola TaxID=2758565 RepID=A0A839AGU0_9HYPH|nr:thioredoxin domain-containing protein [Stappia albiluteola]MBA5778913.1 thioredoxin domain-containing protein [Stappia albiluteola]